MNGNGADSTGMKQVRILHVDDDENDRFFLQRAINAAKVPIVVETAADGQQGLDSLDRAVSAPDLILADIRMPRMTGLEMLEALKAGKWRHVPVVMFSNSLQQVDIERAKELGAEGYWVKPAAIADLVEFVKQLYANWLKAEISSMWPQRKDNKPS